MLADVTDETQHVPDGPDATRIVPDGPDAARAVPDGPLTANATRDLRTGSVAAPPGDPSALPRFGRFAATAKLGAGGMGTVFRAHDDVLGRDVAIKVLHDDDAGVRERFIREARAIGALLHPHILGVYDAGEANGTPFIVMELAGSGSLRDRMKQEPMAIEEVRQVGIQIARALAAAHERGIVHRDVKPGNILCTQPGTWKLADFGIARLPDSTLTVQGQFLGSPTYAAPESLRAAEFSAASDIYSLGVTLYEALVGSPPHGDHDMQSIIRKLETDAPPITSKRAVPGSLGAAIMAAVAREPAHRPSAEVLAQRIADTRHDIAIGAAGMAGVAVGTAALGHGAATHAPGSHRMKLVALGLAAIAAVAIVLAIKGSSEPATPFPGLTRPVEGTRNANDEGGISPPEPPSEPTAPGMPEEGDTPRFVDQDGNPLDEETSKKLLEQMQRDAESSYGSPGRGRGRSKKHKGD